MIAGLGRYALVAAIAAAVGATGAWQTQQWRWTANTLQAQREADELRAADLRQDRQLVDLAAGRHAAELAHINTQLGGARAQIANLSGQRCLDAGTVRVLNDIGADVELRAPAVDAEGAAAAAASDRDVADALATCRAAYAVVRSQVIQILDIEDKRHPVQTPAP